MAKSVEETERVAPSHASSTNLTAQLRRFGLFTLRYGMVLVLAAIVVVATFLQESFLTWRNVLNILSQNAPVGIVAVGMTFVIIGGGFDLSVGAIFGLSATVFASLSLDQPVFVAGIVSLLAGVLAGAFNGFAVTRLRVNPFVATLGSASMISGAALIYSETKPFVVDASDFKVLGGGDWGPLPISVLILMGTFLLAGVVLAKTVYGRNIYSIGGNAEVSRLSGLRVRLVRGSTYALTGLLSAFAGMILASRLGIGQANMGQTVALDAIAIVVVGGTSLLGGEGAMWRTAVGLLIFAVLTNLFNTLSVQPEWQLVAKGAIVVGAVALDSFVRTRTSEES